jgi:hypothetical protein
MSTDEKLTSLLRELYDLEEEVIHATPRRPANRERYLFNPDRS